MNGRTFIKVVSVRFVHETCGPEISAEIKFVRRRAVKENPEDQVVAPIGATRWVVMPHGPDRLGVRLRWKRGALNRESS